MTETDFANHPETDRIIQAGLLEDIGSGDHTTLSVIPPEVKGKMKCLIKSEGILAGLVFAEKVFHHLNPEIKFTPVLIDGQWVTSGDIAFTVEGPVVNLLSGERLVLNAMQRMSGIATSTAAAVEQLKGLSCKVLDTRKTTPLVRHLEKWAVVIGGGMNHRMGLYDMILIKDNHIDFAGGIPQAILAVEKYQQQHQLNLPVIIETRTLEEVLEVLAMGRVNRILLDNMNPDMMQECVHLVGGRYETEASGNITLENIREKAQSGVNYVSLGFITHSYKSMDISLKAEIYTD